MYAPVVGDGNALPSAAVLKFVHYSPRSSRDAEPFPRSGHRIVVDDGNLYSIGGYNPDFWGVPNDEDTYYPLFRELWKFNFANRKWTRLKTNGFMPVELASHTALLHGASLMLFGGTGVPFGEAACNNLHICNLRSLTWNHVECEGEPPIRLYGHSMTIVGRYLYVFGGTTGWEYNADLHRLDMTRWVWEVVKTDSEPPAGRYRHEVACYARKLYIFGGGRSAASYKFKSIPVFEIDTDTWHHYACAPDSVHDFPAARRCHSCVQLQHDVYMCGGYNGEMIFGDFWALNLLSLQWRRLPTDLPQPIYFHAAAVTASGCMVVCGGVTKIDDKRTSNVYTVWLKVPKLKELCWQLLTQALPDMDQIPQKHLLEIGVPNDLLGRLS